MNPAVSREYLLGDLQPVASPKRVLVIGAGPAGMAAARLAAMRGHKVTVAEEAPHTGGLLHAARQAPGRAELGDMVDFYTKELARLGVDLRLSTECDEALVAEIKPEAVIMASGSQLDVPQILGLFDTDMELHMAVDVLEGEAQPGKDVIVNRRQFGGPDHGRIPGRPGSQGWWSSTATATLPVTSLPTTVRPCAKASSAPRSPSTKT